MCSRCETVLWQNPKPASAVAVVDDDSVLLVQRGTAPDEGQWSLPAGFLEIDESHRECAVRELTEETGMQAPEDAVDTHETLKITQRATEHVVVAVFTLDREDARGPVEAGSDAADATFWSADRIEEDIGDVREPYRPVLESIVNQKIHRDVEPKS
ncbi:NUDIX hydrolase [Halorussus caseinilyticus]|uniref:NUDIX hydrolase n=1 Tax=Halorussus caseinilyticus TaxID=3034025 RepID=A0ABD5WEB9_9EURY|nr:NUDIX hydrolase [Halorussus sp. DT72]